MTANLNPSVLVSHHKGLHFLLLPFHNASAFFQRCQRFTGMQPLSGAYAVTCAFTFLSRGTRQTLLKVMMFGIMESRIAIELRAVCVIARRAVRSRDAFAV